MGSIVLKTATPMPLHCFLGEHLKPCSYQDFIWGNSHSTWHTVLPVQSGSPLRNRKKSLRLLKYGANSTSSLKHIYLLNLL